MPLDPQQLPPADIIDHQPIREAIHAVHAARGAGFEARKQLTRFEREHAQAVQRDVEATADALSSGKRDPGGKSVATFEAKLAEMERQAEALELNFRRRLADLNATYAEHRAEWQAQLDQQLEEVRHERDAHLTFAEQDHAKLATVYSLRAFARDPQRYRGAQGFVSSMRLPRVGDGDVVQVGDTFEALRGVGSEPAARITNPAQVVRRWCVNEKYGDDPLRGPGSLIGYRVQHDGHVYNPGDIFNAPIDSEVQAAISQGAIRELPAGTMLHEMGTREFQVGGVSGAER